MNKITASDLAGRLIPAVPVPLDQAGNLHEPALEAYVSWMVQQPIGGVAVWAHTGRGLRLATSVQDRVLTAWRKQLPSSCLLLAAAGAPPSENSPGPIVERAYAMAYRAAELGAQCLLVHPPVALRDRPDRDALVIRYHSRIAEAGLPLVLFYLYDAAGGISYSPQVITDLLSRPDVLGIKIATLDQRDHLSGHLPARQSSRPRQGCHHRRRPLPPLQPDVRRRCRPDRHGGGLHAAPGRLCCEPTRKAAPANSSP